MMMPSASADAGSPAARRRAQAGSARSQRVGVARRSRRPALARRVDRALSELVGERFDVVCVASAMRLAALVEHLHDRADADGEQEGDDENRDGAAQQRLGGQQPPIGRLGDRLRQPLDGIGTCRRTRRFGARHRRPPFGSSPTPAFGRMCRISPNQLHLNRMRADLSRVSKSIFLLTFPQKFASRHFARRLPKLRSHDSTTSGRSASHQLSASVRATMSRDVARQRWRCRDAPQRRLGAARGGRLRARASCGTRSSAARRPADSSDRAPARCRRRIRSRRRRRG